MSINVLFSAPAHRWGSFRAPLQDAFVSAGLDVKLHRDHDLTAVDYIVFAPQPGPAPDFSRFARLKAVLGLWAGVERIVQNKTLTVPLTRMVDSGLEKGMVQWVTGHVLRYHLGMDAQITGQDGIWTPAIPPLTQDRKIGILGIGALGTRCAMTLASLGFQVSGWSRTPKSNPAFRCYDGKAGLNEVLRTSEILVLLLPLTADTENLIDRETLALMPKGARIVNPGRGALIDDDALLTALNSGQVAHATLDVFRTEPLPGNHPYWAHANVTVTPHIASDTRPGTAAQVIAENIRRNEAGETMQFLVDRTAGY